MPTRNVTAPENPRSDGAPVHSIADWERFSGRGDPEQRYRLYRLCPCEICTGSGRIDDAKCPDCRGEGRVRDLVATCADAPSLGVALVTLAREGTWTDDCPMGCLDTEGEVGKKWIVRPWQASPSARNLSDAGRVLARGRKRR